MNYRTLSPCYGDKEAWCSEVQPVLTTPFLQRLSMPSEGYHPRTGKYVTGINRKNKNKKPEEKRMWPLQYIEGQVIDGFF